MYTTPDHGTIRLIMAENDRERSHSLRLMRNGFLDIKVEKRQTFIEVIDSDLEEKRLWPLGTIESDTSHFIIRHV